MGKKRKTIRLDAENEQYLRRIAWEKTRSLTFIVNEIIEEKRKSDSTVTAKACAQTAG